MKTKTLRQFLSLPWLIDWPDLSQAAKDEYFRQRRELRRRKKLERKNRQENRREV